MLINMGNLMQYKWQKRPSGIWDLLPVGAKSFMDIEAGRMAANIYSIGSRKWRVSMYWNDKESWSNCGSTTQGKKIAESWLASQWDNPEIVP